MTKVSEPMHSEEKKFFEGVTIGIPVFNEAQYLEETILSAVHQCEQLIISDNCSTDNSAAICIALAQKFDHIEYVRQPRNLGAVGNFGFLLYSTSTPYFMWLGGHDMIPENYIRTLRDDLEQCEDCVMAYGAAKHITTSGQPVSYYTYKAAKYYADAGATKRLMATIKYLDDCSLVHGLFRTELLKKAWLSLPDLGADHVLLSRAILLGPFAYNPTTHLFRRDAHEEDTTSRQLSRITGQNQCAPPSYKNMQRAQYKLAVNLANRKGISHFFYPHLARYWIARRFGPFGESKFSHSIDIVIIYYSKVLQKLRRLLRHSSTRNSA